LSAGFCEEVVFRGYLQRQFQALWGNTALAITAQAVIFGISHGYQGLRNVVVITVFGALFGILAHWRRSLAPGIAAHAWTDIVAGLIIRR
jgi:membrane protease YdiL (CAAX protease family)